jgi:hypothetical protein
MTHGARQESYQVGPIRVQALSPTLVRLELKGARGFEDRPTFHVVERSWPGARLQREDSPSGTWLRTHHWSVWIPREAQALQDVRVLDPQGQLLVTGKEPLTSSILLPAPGDQPQVWVLGDHPRLVPPTWGATPSPRVGCLAATSGWDLGNDAPDIYVFLPRGEYGHLRTEVLRLTGRTDMPPLYLFGGFHSRYFPYTDEGALSVIREYRERHFPLDVFMVDTDWREGASYGYKIHTRLFPDFQGFIEQAHRLGVRIGLNDHPKAMTQNALDPQEMEYRYTNLARFLWMGVDFWWFDRNWDVCLTGPLPVLCKEVWGMQVFRDMTHKAIPDRRPLIMANVDGIDDGIYLWPPDLASHRFAFQWTGDTLLGWEEMRRGVENILRAGVHSLVPYISEDIGTHEGIPSAEFYLRHWQFAVLSAVVRPHASRSIYFRREPWTFGPAVEALARHYLNMRYRLLPCFYAAARCQYDTGMPLLRRLDLLFPGAPEAAANDQYLLGEDLLVAPILDGEPCNPTVPQAWLRTPGGVPGLVLELFPNENLLGQAAFCRVDPQLDVHWRGTQAKAPHPFSARWKGRITPTRPVQLGLWMEAGGRLYLDGQLIFDHWTQDQWIHSTCNHGLDTLTLEAGHTYDLRVETRHGPGEALCQLFYRPMDLDAPPMARAVWVPPGEWIDAWTGSRHQGPTTIQVNPPPAVIPMFLRAGSLFPLAPEMQHTDAQPWDPITLEIYPHASRVARRELYEDDHWSTAYQRGECAKTRLTARQEARKQLITVTIGRRVGRYQGARPDRAWVLRLHRSPDIRCFTEVDLDGVPISDWSLEPMGPAPTPFQLRGPALDAPVLEVHLPPGPGAQARTVRIRYR